MGRFLGSGDETLSGATNVERRSSPGLARDFLFFPEFGYAGGIYLLGTNPRSEPNSVVCSGFVSRLQQDMEKGSGSERRSFQRSGEQGSCRTGVQDARALISRAVNGAAEVISSSVRVCRSADRAAQRRRRDREARACRRTQRSHDRRGQPSSAGREPASICGCARPVIGRLCPRRDILRADFALRSADRSRPSVHG